MGGHKVECVGVEQCGKVGAGGTANQLARIPGIAEAGADHQRRAVCQCILCRTQHQFRLDRIDRQGRQQADKHTSGAKLQAGTCGEQCGARHAVGTADHRQRTIAALVAVALARPQTVAEITGGQQCAGHAIERQVKIGDRDFAAMIGAVKGVQPRLASDEAEGVRSANGAAQHPPGVAVKAAGNVEGHYRPGKGVDPRDQFGIGARDGPGQADAEQRVDHQ